MSRRVEIFIGDDQQIGTLHYDAERSRESAAFEYSASWLASPERFALSPSLPLVQGPQYHRKTRDGSAFHDAISDTEPDGWGKRVILRDHAKRRQQARDAGEKLDTPALNSLDFLLAVDDASRVGALRFRDENGVFQRGTVEGRRTAPLLIELASLLAATRAVESNNETAADLAFLRGRGTSLGGLRPKCTVIDDDGHLAIGKFPSVGDTRAVTKGEVLALNLAEAAGINTAAARIVDSDGAPVALIRRFDRRADGQRLMYVSAATMLGADPGDAQEHSYTEIVDALRVHGHNAQADIEELWRRMAFTILITNVDDHLHNHGFLHQRRGLWRLSPAFDINPFPERERELKTWISEEAGPEATIDGLVSVSAYFLIKPDRAKAILGKVEQAVSQWRATGRAIGMTVVELDQFADAFEHAERRAVQKML